MRPTVFSLSILAMLAATAAFAQDPAAKPPVINFAPSFTVGGPCPVGMSAQQASPGRTMWTISLEDARQPQSEKSQSDKSKSDKSKSDKPKSEAAPRASDSGVHVELNATKDKAIRQVELAVYFLPPGTRILLLQSGGGGDTANSRKTFNLSAGDHASFKLAGDLLVGPAASITRVRLLSITYADGTSWHTHGSNWCSIEPNRVIPVSAK